MQGCDCSIAALAARLPAPKTTGRHGGEPAKSFQEATASERLRGLKTGQFCPKRSFEWASRPQPRPDSSRQTSLWDKVQRLNSSSRSSALCFTHLDAACHHLQAHRDQQSSTSDRVSHRSLSPPEQKRSLWETRR